MDGTRRKEPYGAPSLSDMVTQARNEDDCNSAAEKLSAVVVELNELLELLTKTLDSCVNERRLTQQARESFRKELDSLKQCVHAEVESARKDLSVKVAIDSESMRQVHKFHEKQREEIRRILEHDNALYLTGFWLWVCTLFFWIGVMAVGIVAVMWAVVGMR